jgi:hypothetical protein
MGCIALLMASSIPAAEAGTLTSDSSAAIQAKQHLRLADRVNGNDFWLQ